MNERKLTVAYLIDDLSLGGAEKQMSMLARALPASIEPVVVCLSHLDQPLRNVLEASGVDVVTIERRSHIEVRRFREAVRVLRDRKADIVHGFLDAANAYAFASARLLGRPVVLSVRSDSLRLSGVKRTALSWMLRHADRVLVNSRRGADYLRNRVGVSEGRLLHIPNWIDTRRDRPTRGASDSGGMVNVGYIGRFAPEKRVGLLVEVFHRLLVKIPDARLILMGEGREKDELVRRIERLNVGNRVEWVPPGLEVEATLRRFHVFVVTSALEGLPNAAIEALAAGIPVASTKVGDMADIIVDGKTGALFESDDPDGMAETLARVITDEALKGNVGVEGPKLVEERFSLERAVARLAEVYRELAR